MTNKITSIIAGCSVVSLLWLTQASGLEESSFSKSLQPGAYVIEADEGNWNWGMAPIYDDEGKLHVFNSIIPKQGSWIRHSRIGHYTADRPEGPYTFVGLVFSSEDSTYHNPQVSKVGDTYVLVFLMNGDQERAARQQVGIATAKALNGPWTESPHNPVIRASGKMGDANIIHASNPSFVVQPDGAYRIYYKSMTDQYPGKKNSIREISFATSDTIQGPYVNYAENPVITYIDQKLDIEDPYAFYYNGMYYMIVEDRRGVADMLSGKTPEGENGGLRPGLFYSSEDGINWGTPELGYQTNEIYFGDKLARSERPSILWKDGHPEYLFLACHDDKPSAGYFLKITDWATN